MKKKLKQKQGITLIALVITIIVLLILAGITINLTLGQDGIIKIAEQAGKNYTDAEEYERNSLGELTNTADEIIGNITSGSGTVESIEIEQGITHTVTDLTYNWGELEKIAKVISDNDDKITKDTLEAKVKINGKKYIVGVGDTKKVLVNGIEKTVRIMGFNHDELTEQSAYGGKNKYAGISFEFIDFITNAKINNTDSTPNGWVGTEIRGILNNTTINTLENKDKIKEVKKQYIKAYSNASSVTTSNDKLWLLSCSEIWNNGYKTGYYGYAITKEGEQYKYYKDINPTWDKENQKLIKESAHWWLRSPNFNSIDHFGIVLPNGSCTGYQASSVGAYGIAPGFAI